MKDQSQAEKALSTSEQEVETRISALVATFPSRSVAAKVGGVSAEQLKRYERGATPRLDVIAKLCEAAGWSIDYVCWGYQSAATYKESADRPRDEKNLENEPHETFVQVPLYDVEAAAGHGSVVSAEPVLGHYAFRRDFIRSRGWQIDKLALIYARGESMPGVIESGQLVLVNLAVNAVHREGVYVLRIDEQLVIKAVQPDHRGNLMIHSTNSLYRDITVPRDEIDELEVIAQAVWTDVLL